MSISQFNENKDLAVSLQFVSEPFKVTVSSSHTGFFDFEDW